MNINQVDLNNMLEIKNYLDKESVNNKNLINVFNTNNKHKFFNRINLFIKRLFDILTSMIGLFFLIPVSIIICVANFISGDFGPLFYSSKRIGKSGNHFNIYKFRSMCIDADKKLDDLLKNDTSLKEEWTKNQKIQNDPRVTKVGNFIRKTSIDELPQVLNVLIGNMSFVGPRPVVDGEIDKFGIFKDTILSMKPGITGNWAVNRKKYYNI